MATTYEIIIKDTGTMKRTKAKYSKKKKDQVIKGFSFRGNTQNTDSNIS